MAKLNITWPQFLYCNDNPTEAFEDMCRRLFIAEYLKEKKRPHTDHNTPGVEVLPILEPERDDSQPLRRISFQAKFVDSTSSGYSKIKESALQTVKHEEMARIAGFDKNERYYHRTDAQLVQFAAWKPGFEKE